MLTSRQLAERLDLKMKKGGRVVDWMHADFWPEDTIDLVLTLRTNNRILFDRYRVRNYNKEKVDENIDAEIMDTIGIENQERYGPEETTTIVELESNNEEDMADNLDRISVWCKTWHTDNNKPLGKPAKSSEAVG